MPNAKDAAARFLTGLHGSVFRATDGRLLGRVAGMPVVMLITTGRKSGKPRSTMLTSPVQEGDRVVLVASYGGAGRWAVGNGGGEYFAVTRRCRHLYADLANGRIDQDGCLVCPWHGSKYDVRSGRMVRGPQGAFAKVPGLSEGFKALTKVVPLG